jgi:HlyD family secretion protein
MTRGLRLNTAMRSVRLPSLASTVRFASNLEARGRRVSIRARDLAVRLGQAPAVDDHEGISRELRLVLYSVAGLVLLALLWAGTFPLAGAVIAAGTVTVDSSVKKVQHQTGGIVGEILVKDGDHVGAGDLLIRLDATMANANHKIITKQLDEVSVKIARLKAERDGRASFAPPVLLSAAAEGGDMLASEKLLFENRATGREGRKAQLKERTAQLQDEISGLSAQLEGKDKEIELISRELKGVQELYRKNLIQITRLTALERDAARIQGERGQIVAALAQARGRITETNLQILQIDDDMRSDVGKELREAQARESELTERRIAAEDQLARTDIRSPQKGIVHQLAVHTVGGTVSPSEPIMLIVPQDDELVIEGRVPPQSIDHVAVGQKAMIRLTAFDQRTTPEFESVVTRVSADLAKDQQTNASYYVVRLTLPALAAPGGEHFKVIPGMPAEIFLQTKSRTALSYLFKPFLDQIHRVFRE